MMKKVFRRIKETWRIDRFILRSILFTLPLIKRRHLLALILLGTLISIIVVPFQKSLVLEEGKTKRLLAYVPLYKEVQTFGIHYTHSIHLTEVEETYHILEGGIIRQIELKYEDTSIGMPSNAENEEKFVVEDGKYLIKNMKRDFPSIYMRTAQVVGTHKLIVGENEVDFTTFATPGSLVHVQIKRLSLWEMWKGVVIDG